MINHYRPVRNLIVNETGLLIRSNRRGRMAGRPQTEDKCREWSVGLRRGDERIAGVIVL